MKEYEFLSREVCEHWEAIKRLPPEEFYALLVETECEIDLLLEENKISQEEAWDYYFALLHECDLGEFWEAREWILTKIDTKHYNPFTSSNPAVIHIARERLQGNSPEARPQ